MPWYTRQNRPEVKRPAECDPTTGEVGRKSKTTSAIYHPSYHRTNVTQGRFKVGPVAGQSSHASGIAKNTFGPVGIALIRGASGASQ